MNKLFFIASSLMMLPRLSQAQSSVATGTVKDQQGNPVRYAFLRDRPSNFATFSDSLGNFKITVNPGSVLDISAMGFASKVTGLSGNTTFNIALVRLNGNESAVDLSGRTQQSASPGIARSNQNFQFEAGAVFAPKNKGDAHGSQYFFDNWAHGFVIDNKDSLVENPAYLYNYDKINGGLIYTTDTKSAMEASRGQVKSFTLFSNSGETAVFETVPQIDNTHYMQVLASGKKYKIYKLVTTKFVKSDYQTNGISSSGNNYDEYIDAGTYYVFNVTTSQVQPLLLKKKSIKAAFASDADRLNKFMSANNGDIDDAYLTKLGDYLNN